MIDSNELYRLCKQFVKKYEQEERNFNKNQSKFYVLDKEEYLKHYYIEEESDIQALVTEDFIKTLPHELQEQIIAYILKEVNDCLLACLIN